MNDQIKLAELIGWKKHKTLIDPQVWNHPNPEKDGWYYEYQLPEPFINANDDYKILLWAREKRGIPRDVGTRYQNFMAELRLLQMKRDKESSILHEAYEIGDNAHAVLNMINEYEALEAGG